jgi:aconitate hydratase
MNSLNCLAQIRVEGQTYAFYSLAALERQGFPGVARLPYSLKILLENLLRHEDGAFVKRDDILALANWDPRSTEDHEINFHPARVLLQDFTGVPAVADLAAMRDAVKRMGGDPGRINPLLPAELVIDHSVQVDKYGTPDAFQQNADLEYQRNRERYLFLRWAQKAFRNFTVVPPETGIVHQVNLETLARVVFSAPANGGRPVLYPDSLVGTDSHTTMVNGIGVVGWGVGGIEAEACMLGQPISMLIPPVVGFRLKGRPSEGVTATDVVLTITEMLRKKGVVGKFVEYFGAGLDNLPAADRSTISNMSPEYGATIGIFPVDDQTLSYLRLTGRSEQQVKAVEAYCKEQGLFRTADAPEAVYTDTLELDLASVEPSLAGPRRPHDRVPLRQAKPRFQEALAQLLKAAPAKAGAAAAPGVVAEAAGSQELNHGAVVIASITSCTNTSNPSVLIGAGLLAKKAVERGLKSKPWVKTSLAPGSKAVTEYLQETGLLPYLEKLGFYLVGYGCTTCIGNSGPLPESVAREVKDRQLVAVSVLSGNRNFEGRIQPLVRANYLASPPLVVAYALAGTMDIDLYNEPLGNDPQGRPVFLRDLWPSDNEIQQAMAAAVRSELFQRANANALEGDERWKSLDVPTGDLFAWDPASTYIKRPPFFEELPPAPAPPRDVRGARVLALLGDSVTTDHISPAGSIPADGPAGKYLISLGVTKADFNSFGARRGNHEVMMRGTFGNIRLRNLLVPGAEGNWTLHFPDGEKMPIFDAAIKYQGEGVPLIILAGKEYGSGSSRDWAAKGTVLLGVRAVIAESFERIHRSNLVGMGVLPLEFQPGESAGSLGLTGQEIYEIDGATDLKPRKQLSVRAASDGAQKQFSVRVRIDTPQELQYYRHGGILPYVLRNLLKG